jgi:hypothetical protein
MTLPAPDGDTLLLRIPAMDCPTEEGQIVPPSNSFRNSSPGL